MTGPREWRHAELCAVVGGYEYGCNCGLSAVRDAIRDLCEAVAELAAGTVHLLGTDRAGEIISKVLSVSRDMDSLDQEATDD